MARKKKLTMKKNNEIDIAWASGLFEGEGCIFLSKAKGRRRKDGKKKPKKYLN